jgi:vitamin B12 transporter
MFSLAAACASCALAVVSSPAPTPTPPVIAHVYTADRVDETLKNATRTTYVVTHDDIVRNGYRTIEQALERVPGVTVFSYGPIGSESNVGIRGSSSSQTLILIDGIPAPGGLSNTVELGNLPTTGVDRIEIVEGGGSTLYGTGAIGGIINIITQRHAENEALARAGSFGDREIALQTPYLQFSRIVSNNAFGLPNGQTLSNNDYEGTALHGNYERTLGSIDAAFRAGIASDGVGVNFGYNPFGTPAFARLSRDADLNEDADLTLSHKSAQAQATLQFGATRQDLVYHCNDGPNFCYPTTSSSYDTEGRVDLGLRNAVTGADEDIQYGIDLSRGVVRSDAGLSPGAGVPAVSYDALAQSAAYVQQRYTQRWGQWYAGLRGERDGSLGGEFSPSAGLTVRLSNEASFKVNAASAFRAPNASELYYPGFGDPALRPERAKVADATIVDTSVLGGASLGWFTNWTNQLITLNPTTFALQQVQRAQMQGFTFDVKTLPYNGFVASFNATDLYRAQNMDANTRLPARPVMLANLGLEFRGAASSELDSWGVTVRMAGQRGNVDPTQPLYYQPAAFASTDAYLRLRAGGGAFVTLRGYNLGNERYAEINGYPMPGRSYALEVSTK